MKNLTKIVRWLSIRAVALGSPIRSLRTLDAQLIRANLQAKRLIAFFRTDTLRAWGYMDISFLSLYSIMTLLDGEVPFLSALKIVFSITTEHPLIGSALLILYLAVFSSLFATAILLYQRKPKARYIAYAQTPFRLLMLLPSITPFYLLLAAPLWFFWAPFIVVAISETIKIRSLRRYIRQTNTPIYSTKTATPSQNPMEF